MHSENSHILLDQLRGHTRVLTCRHAQWCQQVTTKGGCSTDLLPLSPSCSTRLDGHGHRGTLASTPTPQRWPWMGSWVAGTVGVPETSGPDTSKDVATRDAVTGAVVVNATTLYSRIDGSVASGIAPMTNLQNGPWALSRNESSRGSYGEMAPPSNMTEWGVMVRDVVRLLVARYGHDAVAKWRFRVWTEPNNPDSFSGTVDDYAEMYDHAANAIVSTLGPSAIVGPSNFCRACTLTAAWPYWSGVERLLDHFRDGVNYATGLRGSPVGFLAMSCYGNYGGERVVWGLSGLCDVRWLWQHACLISLRQSRNCVGKMYTIAPLLQYC